MSLPALGLEEPVEVPKVKSTHYERAKESEWRFEVAANKYARVKVRTHNEGSIITNVMQLLSGTAELFDTELIVSPNAYVFENIKATIFTWQGCTVEVSGDALQGEYTAQATPIKDLNVHFALDILRHQAKASGREGLRVLILRSEDVGKSTLAKTLTSYAIRGGRSPVVANLDIGEGVMSVPGTVTTTIFRSIIDVDEGWERLRGADQMVLSRSNCPSSTTLVSNGHMKKKTGHTHLRSAAWHSQRWVAQDSDAREGGRIIGTPGSLTSTKAGRNVGYDITSHIVSEISVNYMVCLGSERLYSDMVKRLDSLQVGVSHPSHPAVDPESISVIKLARSGGWVDRDPSYMAALRASQIRR